MIMKRRVFVSFDFDNDKALKDFIIGQARNADSPFEVSDFSLKEAWSQSDWETKARHAIARSDMFIVMLGPKTRIAPGVRKEVSMATQLSKRRFQIIGYRWGFAPMESSKRWSRLSLELEQPQSVAIVTKIMNTAYRIILAHQNLDAFALILRQSVKRIVSDLFGSHRFLELSEDFSDGKYSSSASGSTQ